MNSQTQSSELHQQAHYIVIYVLLLIRTRYFDAILKVFRLQFHAIPESRFRNFFRKLPPSLRGLPLSISLSSYIALAKAVTNKKQTSPLTYISSWTLLQCMCCITLPCVICIIHAIHQSRLCNRLRILVYSHQKRHKLIFSIYALFKFWITTCNHLIYI